MPIYEYRCQTCQKHFEHWQQGFDDPQGLRCPHCESDQITKQLHAPGIVFKGGGFYKTDSRSNSSGSSSVASSSTTDTPKTTATESKADTSGKKSKKAVKGEKAEGKK